MFWFWLLGNVLVRALTCKQGLQDHLGTWCAACVGGRASERLHVYLHALRMPCVYNIFYNRLVFKTLAQGLYYTVDLLYYGLYAY